MRYPVSFRSLTIFHNSPDWRYQIIKNVEPVLRYYQRPEAKDTKDKKDVIGKYLLRFIGECPITIIQHPICVLSDSLMKTIYELPYDLRDKFFRIRSKLLRKNHERKFIIEDFRSTRRSNTSWVIKNLEDIDDKWVIKIIKSYSGVDYNKAIKIASDMRVSPKHDEILRYIGYCIFLGKTDLEVSKMWEISITVIEAIRFLFFDFSRLPKDTIAKMTFFRQLVQNGSYTQTDFNFFKLLDELGDTGLKALTSFKLFNKEDKDKIEIFYGTSMLENVLRLKLAVRDSNDAVVYSNVINQLGTFYMKKAELKLSNAKTNNIDANTRKLEQDMGNQVKGGQEHEKLLDAVKHMGGEIRKLSLEDSEQPKYRPITELK